MVGHVRVHFSLTHAQKPTDSQLNTVPIPGVTSPRRDGLSWFHGQLPVPFLSLYSGIKDCISWESPLRPAVSTYHMASACADHRGLWLVPYLSAPHGTDNVSLKLKPQSVSMRVHAKKAIHKLLDNRMNFKQKSNAKGHRIHRTLTDAAFCFFNVYVLKIKKNEIFNPIFDQPFAFGSLNILNADPVQNLKYYSISYIHIRNKSAQHTTGTFSRSCLSSIHKSIFSCEYQIKRLMWGQFALWKCSTE